MKKKRFLVLAIFMVVLMGILAPTVYPLIMSLNHGVDLKGGFEVLYEVKPLEDGAQLTDDAVKATYKAIERRINVLGVSEPEITIEGNNKIRVRLAGATNEEEAKEIMSKPAVLTFRDTNDILLMNSDVLKQGGAKVTSDANGMPAVLLPVSNKQEFYDVTNRVKDYPDDRIVIWLDYDKKVDNFSKEESSCGNLEDSKCISAASLNKQAFMDDVIISGNFSVAEATKLANLINSGSVPTKLEELASYSVDATLGATALEDTLFAGVIGIVAIMLIMVIIYRFAGVIASISILLYTLGVFGLFYMIGGVLSLPSLAAVLLGIGMAIDACVISYERIKEELKQGKTPYQAFKVGNKQSLSSILDANVTTFIVALVLFIFGEGSVKGFATMLIINIIITIIVMVFINKVLLGLFIRTGFFNNKAGLLIGIKRNYKVLADKKEKVKNKFNFNFVFSYKKYLLITLIVLVMSFLIMFVSGGLNLGIDFRGGSTITVNHNRIISEDKIKTDVTSLGYTINNIENDSTTTFVRVEETLTTEQSTSIVKYFDKEYDIVVTTDIVSSVVKQELTKNAIMSLVIASAAIIIYIGLRFKLSYAISAIVALLHDVLFVIILFGLFKIEINTIFIAAVLAVVGYSINDTIVSFDRIRENFRKKHNRYITDEEELKQLVNDSLNQTLTRTIYTSITTILPVAALIIFGAYDIINFNIAMLIGLIFGSYSSLFVASQLWTLLELIKIKKGINNSNKKEKNTEEEVEEMLIKGINS